MKTFQLATMLRILEDAKNVDVTQVEIANKLILSIVGPERYKQFSVDGVAANRLASATRTFTKDILKIARSTSFDTFKNRINDNILPLLVESKFGEIEKLIKVTLKDDDSILSRTHIGPIDDSFTKESILNANSLSFVNLLAGALYYVAINSSAIPEEKSDLRSYIKRMLARNDQVAHQSISSDDKKVIEELLIDADNGVPDAEFCLGYMYFHGISPIPQNYHRAGYYLNQASLQGDAEAIYMLYHILKNGLDVERNVEQALSLLQMSAELEYNIAQFELGQLYYEGELLPKNMAKAIEWWEKAAEQDNADASLAMGGIYEYGLDGVVKRNIGMAYRYYHKAKDLGHPLAQHYLDELL